jgi:hypothetical protein
MREKVTINLDSLAASLPSRAVDMRRDVFMSMRETGEYLGIYAEQRSNAIDEIGEPPTKWPMASPDIFTESQSDLEICQRHSAAELMRPQRRDEDHHFACPSVISLIPRRVHDCQWQLG